MTPEIREHCRKIIVAAIASVGKEAVANGLEGAIIDHAVALAENDAETERLAEDLATERIAMNLTEACDRVEKMVHQALNSQGLIILTHGDRQALAALLALGRRTAEEITQRKESK